MASNKAALKAAKAAVDAEDWDKVILQAQTVLASDTLNYFAYDHCTLPAVANSISLLTMKSWER